VVSTEAADAAEGANAEGETPVTAGAPAEPSPGTLLYTF
jgi:hypothetical protein